jgi:hypothetical protein
MNLDLRLIIRKKEKEISWIIKEVQKWFYSLYGSL